MSERESPRLGFERVMAGISSTLISLPAREVDDQIDDVLRILGEHLEVDRAFVYEFDEGRATFSLKPYWAAEPLDFDPFSVRVELEFPWLTAQLLRGEHVVISNWDQDLPTEAVKERAYYQERGLRAAMFMPLAVGGAVIGLVAVTVVRTERRWTPEDERRLRLVADVIGNALTRKRQETALRAALAEVEALSERLQQENIYLQQEIQVQFSHEKIIGRSEALRRTLTLVERVAPTDTTVLVLGETGTGKELLARAIHGRSARRERPMVKVNCGALPATLIEAELFGREKGAYTGAVTSQSGRFQVAHDSTIFLDEIGELPLELQAKLLGVLQDGRFERLGSPRPVTVDVRVIAATHRDLAQAVAEGKFREDLYYRLSVFPITVPPLRERVEDIPELVGALVLEFEKTFQKRMETIPRATMEALTRYPWPGNIRELRNVIERAMILSDGPTLEVEVPQAPAAATRATKLADVERQHILGVLARTGWRVRGARGAASLLGIKPTTLEARMLKLGITRPGGPAGQ
jgi:transcriptional regulator with GAF, ATPase, and Fis domain